MSTKSQLEHLGLFDARVPRYTSYPTAPHFTPAVDETTYRGWISSITGHESISLYLHVPFCRRLCWFCACRTQGTQSDAPVRAYVETLLAELEMLRKALPEGIRLSRLHWGRHADAAGARPRHAACGCGPCRLSSGRRCRVLGRDRPQRNRRPRMEALAAAGLTRASIGVQDFDPEIQKTIGREQSFEVTARAVDLVRAHGIASLNADILFGLPGQDHEKIAQTVQKLLALSPDRVALYGYAHVPWVARRQVMIPPESLPAPRDRLALFEVARALFVADGYVEIGIDHFARPGDGLAQAQRDKRLRRNFQGYTDDAAQVLIGLGASSISRFPQGYAQNAPATGAHSGAIREGRFSVSRGHVFTPEDLWRARMIEALMCDFAVDFAALRRDFGLDDSAIAAAVAPISARFRDMVELSRDRLEITPEGRPLVRMIAQMLDRYDAPALSHSTAI
ncbi:radical SAM protein [Paracoccus cavernae]|uniref:Coproporphyrinogen-III oxidase n=1 Tax=Paracoccus cavernae TaxID=1571207 RepID=A0ABT8D5J7_9RHOB|nr:radical SAM protein [Paracoccus cavernae]